MALPEASLRYAILFTPRSGSSWLTDICMRSAGFGRPDEAFNPAMLPNMARAMDADTLDRYCAALLRRRNRDGVFGVEVTPFHLLAVFRGAGGFLQRIRPQHLFWLIREDILAQAVSVSRMQQTRVAHRVPGAGQAAAPFRYRPLAIRLALLRLEASEIWAERMFARRGLAPHRLSYETMMAAGAERMLAHLASVMGRPAPDAAPEPRHEKLGDALNGEYAARFAADHPRLMARLAARRQARVAAARRWTEEPT